MLSPTLVRRHLAVINLKLQLLRVFYGARAMSECVAVSRQMQAAERRGKRNPPIDTYVELEMKFDRAELAMVQQRVVQLQGRLKHAIKDHDSEEILLLEGEIADLEEAVAVLSRES